MALRTVHPEFMSEETTAAKLKYPRPISEPPSPSTSRATTPVSSNPASEDEADEAEVEVLTSKDQDI